MIGQYLPNNNEERYSAILPKILDLNRFFITSKRARARMKPKTSWN
jgi:hypothetical protein